MTQPAWTEQDRACMAEALRQARKGLYSTDPNPRVGCVIVSGGQILASAWHQRAGEGHAEVNALAQAGQRARGAAAYVTLEPCSHTGKTGPCALALIQAGVAEVVIAMRDPNPQVAGRGIKLLEQAGITVRVGLMQAQAEELNPGFIKRMEQGLPFVRIKLAMSVDGRTAMASGESKWITGPAARSDVQKLRARSSAILTGSGTVMHDDPQLNVRLESSEYPGGQIRQPDRVVLDWAKRLKGTERVFEPGAGARVLYLASSANENLVPAEHLETMVLEDEGLGRPDLKAVLKNLAAREYNEVLVESGAQLAGAFVAQACWDELVVYMAPKLMGSLGRPLLDLPLDSMNQSHGLKLTDVRQVGDDIRFTYRPA